MLRDGFFVSRAGKVSFIVSILLLSQLGISQSSWQKFSSFVNVGGSADENARQMVADSSGNLYTLCSSGSGLVVSKRDGSGNPVWRSYFPGEPSGLSLTSDGGVAVVGRIDRGNSPSAREILVLKYDGSGGLLWKRTLLGATGQSDPGMRIAGASDGSIYVGATVNQDSFSDISLIKYSPTGDLLWQQTKGPNPDQEICGDVKIDPSGNIVVYGNRNPSFTGQVVLYKFLPAGTTAWAFVPSTKGLASGFAMDTTGASYIPISGSTPAVVKVSSSGTQSWKASLSTTNLPLAIGLLGTTAFVSGSQTTGKCFVSKISSTGSVSWTATHTPPAGTTELLNSVGVASDGSVYAGGNRALTGAAGIFTMKVGSTGTFSWALDHGVYTYTPPLVPPVNPVAPPPIPTQLRVNASSQPVLFSTINGIGNATGYDSEICVDTAVGTSLSQIAPDQNGTNETVDALVTDPAGTSYILADTQQGNGADVSLAQFASNGATNWLRGFGGPGPDLGYAIAREVDGGVVAAYGVFNSNTNLWDTRIRRLDSAGNTAWTAQLPGSAHIVSMTCASDGSIYSVGQDQTTSPNRFRTTKVGADGTVLWSTLFPGIGPSDDFPFKLALDNSGRVFVAGHLWDGTKYLATIQRYDPSVGAVMWTRTYSSSGAGASGFTLLPDNGGGAYLAGTDWAQNRGLLRRYDSSGNLLFNRVINEQDTAQERFWAAALDPTGNVVTAGSAVRFDKNIDLLVAKYTSSGNLIWKHTYDGPAGLNDLGKYLAVDKAGRIYVAGQVSGGVTGRDYVIWRLNADGSAGWPDSGDGFTHSAIVFDSGLGLADTVAGLTVDDVGSAYLAGTAVGPNNTYDMHLMKFGPSLSSTFVSQTTPTTMVAGQTYYVSFVFANNSNSTWTAAGGYGIGTMNPVDNLTWGTNHVPLGASDSIAPGGTMKLLIHFLAPATPGTYNFQWSMRQDGVGPFGEPSTNVPVVVSVAPNAAQYVSQNPPTSIKAGASFTVTLKMKNVGSNTWTTAGAYGLAPSGSTQSWNITLASVGSNVAPGVTKSFTLSCKAPTTPGSYVFRFQMRNSSGFFGDRNASKTITVTP